MDRGWICVHRQIVSWEWYQDANTFRVFMHLILNANHEDKMWQNVLVKKGQIVTSYSSISKALGISVQQARTSINKLKSTGEITIKATNKYTLINIEKYTFFQTKPDEDNNQNNNQDNNQITNKQQAEQQQTTNKQLNNNNNIYISTTKEYGPDFYPEVDEEYREKIMKAKNLFSRYK